MPSASLAQIPLQPKLVEKGCAGPPPAADLVCRGVPICEKGADGINGIWKPGPSSPNGSGCTFVYQKLSVGSKCSDGLCAAPPAGTSGWFQPAYILIGVLYAPPGNKSSIAYSAGSTLGSTQDVANSSGNGILTGATLFGVTTSTSDVTTTTNDQSFTVTTSQASGPGGISTSDNILHDQDQFYILSNPKINFSQPYAGIPGLTLSFDPSDKTLAVTVETVTGAVQDIYHTMDGWSAADKKGLLALDPFVADSTTTVPTTVDPNRFTLLQQFQMQGPAPGPNTIIPTHNLPLNGSSNTCDKTTYTDQLTVSVTGSYNFFGIAGASGGESFTTGFSTSNQTCGGTTHSAMLTLGTSTVGYNRVIAVYFDSLFSTFAFVDKTPLKTLVTHDITGKITNSAGSPLANQQINVTTADGITRTLFSDSQGNYTILSPPAGTMMIRSGDLVLRAQAHVNKSGVVPLKVPNPAVLLPRPTPPPRVNKF